jgi:hypothetical protein
VTSATNMVQSMARSYNKSVPVISCMHVRADCGSGAVSSTGEVSCGWVP